MKNQKFSMTILKYFISYSHRVDAANKHRIVKVSKSQHKLDTLSQQISYTKVLTLIGKD